MAETQIPNLKLNSGHLMPQLGLGTWQVNNWRKINNFGLKKEKGN